MIDDRLSMVVIVAIEGDGRCRLYELVDIRFNSCYIHE